MIRTELVEINGTQFTHTYSDSNCYVVREEIEYEDAYDLADLGRVYTEGRKIDATESDELLDIILGGSE